MYSLKSSPSGPLVVVPSTGFWVRTRSSCSLLTVCPLTLSAGVPALPEPRLPRAGRKLKSSPATSRRPTSPNRTRVTSLFFT